MEGDDQQPKNKRKHKDPTSLYSIHYTWSKVCLRYHSRKYNIRLVTHAESLSFIPFGYFLVLMILVDGCMHGDAEANCFKLFSRCNGTE